MTTSYKLRLTLGVLSWIALFAIAAIYDRIGLIGLLWLTWYALVAAFVTVSCWGIVGVVLMVWAVRNAPLWDGKEDY